MGRHVGMPMVTTSVRISPEFHKLCVDNRFSFSEAMRVGISVMLAEKGIGEYDNDLNLKRQHDQLKVRLAESLQKLSEFENAK